MATCDGSSISAKLKVKGKYILTDDFSIPANGQYYELEVINYFELQDNKIIKGICWFNEDDFIRQISKN